MAVPSWLQWAVPTPPPQGDDESNWAYGAKSGLGAAMTPTALLNAVTPGMGFINAPVIDFFNRKPKAKAAVAKPAGTLADPLTFSTPGATTPSGGDVVGPTADPHSDPTTFFTQLVGKSVKVNSAQRDPAHNAAVGGVPNSQHLSGDAWDISVPGMTGAELAEKIRLSGVPFHQLIVEGNGVHFGAPEGHNDGRYMLRHGDAHDASYSMITPTIGANSNPYTAAPEVAMDPATAMSYIPAPHMLRGVKLPAPPVEEAPAPLTPLNLLDKTALLAPLVAAENNIPDHRSKHAAWDRIASMLEGAATAASGVGPAPTMGQLLLAAGGGAGRGFRNEKEKQTAEDEAHDNMVRQAQVALAQAGINVDLSNFQTGNTNVERGDTSAERARVVRTKNADAAWGTLNDQIKLNLGIDEHNVSTANQYGLARGQAGLAAAEGGVGAQNRTNQTQGALNLARVNAEDSGAAFETGVNKLADKYGIPTKPTGVSDPLEDNARNALRFVKAGNVDGALGSLAEEIVRNGSYMDKDVIDTNKPAGALLAKNIKTLIDLKNIPAATALLSQALSADHASAAEIADVLAKRGNYRVAQIIAGERKK